MLESAKPTSPQTRTARRTARSGASRPSPIKSITHEAAPGLSTPTRVSSYRCVRDAIAGLEKTQRERESFVSSPLPVSGTAPADVLSVGSAGQIAIAVNRLKRCDWHNLGKLLAHSTDGETVTLRYDKGEHTFTVEQVMQMSERAQV